MSKIKDQLERVEIERIEGEEAFMTFEDVHGPSREPKKLKATHHFPTEQYGFVEVEEEVSSIEEAIENYNRATRAKTAPGSELGLPNREWLKVAEHYLNTGELLGGAETWEKLSKYQADWVQETKRCLKRLAR